MRVRPITWCGDGADLGSGQCTQVSCRLNRSRRYGVFTGLCTVVRARLQLVLWLNTASQFQLVFCLNKYRYSLIALQSYAG